MADTELKKGDKNKANALFFFCDTMNDMDYETNEKKTKKFFKELIPYAVIIVVVILIKVFVITPVRVNGSSMSPTLLDGDIMIMDILTYKISDIKRYDIVVVDEGKEWIIKRVYGLPGETIKIEDGKTYIGGQEIKDEFSKDFLPKDKYEVKLGKNEYFVLGDNRQNSLDSRAFGAFKKSKIKGKTDIIIFPFNRFKLLNTKE